MAEMEEAPPRRSNAEKITTFRRGTAMHHGGFYTLTVRARWGNNVRMSRLSFKAFCIELYADDTTGLYGQSAVYVFSLFCEEMEEQGITKP